jgi:hypothetical protein
MFYGSQRITIVGTGMNHGRYLAEVLAWGWKGCAITGYWRRHPPSVVEEHGFSQCQKMCTRRRTASFYSFSDESVDSTSLHEATVVDHPQNTNNWPEGEIQFIQLTGKKPGNLPYALQERHFGVSKTLPLPRGMAVNGQTLLMVCTS